MKRIASLALALVLAVGIGVGVAGCANAGSDDTLTIMGNDSNLQNVYMQRIFDLYEERTGKDIELIPIDNEGYNDYVVEHVDGPDAPDIVMTFNNSLMADLGGTEQFVDLSGEPWVGDLEDGSRAYSSDADGAILGLPFWESSVSGTYYNKRILEDLGLRPATNQEEFDQLCAALVLAGHTPIALGNDGCYGVYQFGIDPIVADDPEVLEKLNAGELKFSDIPEVVSMVQWLKSANDKGWFGDTTDIGYKDWSPAVADGDATMLFTWSTWFDTDFEPGKYTADDFGLMPFFLGTEPDGTYEGGNLNLLAVNKAGDDQEQALEFLEFCADPENYNFAFDGISTNPVFKGQTTNIESPMVVEVEEDVAAKERPSTAEPKIRNYNARAINDAVHSYLDGDISLDECLRLMDESLQPSE